MTNTTKTVASIATAAVIAGGVVLYNTTSDTEIDWSQYDLNVPTLNLPDLGIPNISNLVSLNIPNVNTDLNIGVDTGVNTNLDTDVSTGASTNLDTDLDTGVNVTTIAGDVNILNNIVDVKISDTELQKLNIDSLEIVDDLDNNYVSITSVDDPTKNFPELIKLGNAIKSLFVDKRSISYDNTFVNNTELMKKWIAVYEQYAKKEDISYVPIKNKFRMITEVRTPKTNNQLSILNENLTYYKSQGYDSVLYAFDKNDNYNEVLNTIKYIINYHKMNVWLTYTGDQKLEESVLMDLDSYTNILKNCAPYISGYINSWRRTSAHLFVQDAAFMNYTNNVLRSANSNLPIIGQLYFGNTFQYHEANNIGFGLNNFKNSSGIMIVNFGFIKIDVDYLLNTFLKPYIKDYAKIACVVGKNGGYLSKQTKFTYKDAMNYKHQVENNFLKHGCIGTVTFSDDGKHVNKNNLSQTLYSTLNSSDVK